MVIMGVCKVLMTKVAEIKIGLFDDQGKLFKIKIGGFFDSDNFFQRSKLSVFQGLGATL